MSFLSLLSLGLYAKTDGALYQLVVALPEKRKDTFWYPFFFICCNGIRTFQMQQSGGLLLVAGSTAATPYDSFLWKESAPNPIIHPAAVQDQKYAAVGPGRIPVQPAASLFL